MLSARATVKCHQCWVDVYPLTHEKMNLGLLAVRMTPANNFGFERAFVYSPGNTVSKSARCPKGR